MKYLHIILAYLVFQTLIYEQPRIFNQIINSVPDPIFVKDDKHRWVLLNEAFCDFMGYKNDELLGKSDFDFFPEDQAKVFWEKDELVFETGLENTNEENFSNRKGELRIISTKKNIFIDSDGNKWLVGVIRDITDVKSYQKTLKEKNEELEFFASAAAHDLKSPLRTIQGFCEILQSRMDMAEKDKELFTFISESSSRMGELVEDLLNYARSGSFRGEPKAIKLSKILDYALSTIPQIESLNINLPKEDLEIFGYRSGLILLFQNLISNSIKYSDKSKPIEVSIDSKTKGESSFLRLTDQGIGIEKDLLPNIFKPFQRFSDQRIEGTGLGLASCKKIVDYHKGKIWVESEKGVGTTFHIELPNSPSGF